MEELNALQKAAYSDMSRSIYEKIVFKYDVGDGHIRVDLISLIGISIVLFLAIGIPLARRNPYTPGHHFRGRMISLGLMGSIIALWIYTTPPFDVTITSLKHRHQIAIAKGIESLIPETKDLRLKLQMIAENVDNTGSVYLGEHDPYTLDIESETHQYASTKNWQGEYIQTLKELEKKVDSKTDKNYDDADFLATTFQEGNHLVHRNRKKAHKYQLLADKYKLLPDNK